MYFVFSIQSVIFVCSQFVHSGSTSFRCHIFYAPNIQFKIL